MYYRNTIIVMANILSTEKQIAIIAALAEGSSIRSIERMTGVHRDTIMRLGVRIGQGCARIMDEKMRDLPCTDIQLDEIWGFVGKKQRHLRATDDATMGDAWTWVAIDRDSKAVPCFKVGKRDNATAKAFVGDLAGRLKNRPQISTDGLKAYADAIDCAFGTDVDYGSIVKTYATIESITPERRYSQPEVIDIKRYVMMGDPDESRICTSHIERLKASTRLYMKRLNRLTLAFSKKLENFEAAVGLHFASYNFVKRHSSIRMTPAMALGIEKDFWTYSDLVERAS
jgi:IS1 family transposase